MSGGPADPARQAEALTAQVKLLLRTEQRLLRAQRQAEVQVRRLEALNAFALRAPRSYAAVDIAGLALDLLWAACGAQAAVALVRPPGRGGGRAVLLRAEDRPAERVRQGPPPGDPAWEAWAAGVLALEPGQDAGPVAPVTTLLDRLAPPTGWERRAHWRRTLVLPLGEGPAGAGHGALVACRCAVATAGDPAGPVDRGWLELLRHHASAALEIAALHAEQAERVEARTADLEVANHQLQANLAQLQDAQARLVEASRLAAVGQLAAAVAHEINNPLSSLKANVAWLAEADVPPGPERAEVQADILAAVRRIALAVARLRDLAAGNLPPGGGAATTGR